MEQEYDLHSIRDSIRDKHKIKTMLAYRDTVWIRYVYYGVSDCNKDTIWITLEITH